MVWRAKVFYSVEAVSENNRFLLYEKKSLLRYLSDANSQISDSKSVLMLEIHD